MTYKEYQTNHEDERKDADGCEGCTYQDREPWETPCLICKRNAMGLYERRSGGRVMELISRDKALMNARPEYLNPNQEKLASYNQGWNNAIEMYCKQIAELPTIEERKEGEWISHGDDQCSICGMSFPDLYPLYNSANFCPNCGSRMRKMKGVE